MEAVDASTSDGSERAPRNSIRSPVCGIEKRFAALLRPLKSGLRHWPQPRQTYLHLLQPNTNSFGRAAGFLVAFGRAAGFLSVALAAAGILSVALAAAGFVAVALAAAGFLSVAFGLADAAFGRPDVEPASNFDCIYATITSAVAGIGLEAAAAGRIAEVGSAVKVPSAMASLGAS